MKRPSLPRVLSAGAILLLVFTAPLLTGCDDESLTAPEIQTNLFNSYVALGNSLTAGFQSSGINENTQRDSYAFLLSEQMGTQFTLPVLSNPGCPPPLSQVLPPQRISDEPCAFRAQPSSPTINNVAVPGAATIDVLSNRRSLADPSALTQFILGGKTQIEAAKQANPTFATVWIGNNDVLDGAVMGDTTLVTSVDSFETRYTQLVNQLESINTLEGAVFLGVADVTLIPHFSRGAAYRQAIGVGQSAGVLPPNLEVTSCAPSESGTVLIPFQHGAALVETALGLRERLGSLAPTITIDCSEDRTVEEAIRQNVPDDLEDTVVSQIDEDVRPVSFLTPPEISFLQDRVATFNEQVIREKVNDDYGYVNPNTLFQSNIEQIPVFPELFENPETPWGTDQPFGPLFSLDGIHPSTTTHHLVANALIDEINNTYDDAQLSPVSTP
ncbi:SGNH/GDSL hydrolase family protein [Salinibacter grassmerensis]|uniref:SGNH/GDSL hydrolase family protein n=1 Tax=Salinibacter grassmerensis TaxID=3040353 RepID=UPI0021E91296|nr:SGNH/GDSL hydrolase family protein [Salinibacter grassmerensis]